MASRSSPAPALLLAPMLALLQQSAMLALAAPACTRQSTWWLHVLAALSVLVCAASTLLAWRAMRRAGAGDAAGVERQAFLAQVALGVGAMSTLAALALWAPPWLLPVCLS